eukprot:TRINITY_DN26811_c0_g1_i1.p1 TRINITY_DN26811_c0_g1~~TRINITY_DN26811_c0_g1_i1.p1  ORF type:complete len:312 (+),score=54.83 TRINITY_DN26811_c0_g1_i1:628-1563(+)
MKFFASQFSKAKPSKALAAPASKKKKRQPASSASSASSTPSKSKSHGPKKVADVPRDEEGNLIFPIKLGVLIVESLGEVSDKAGYHNKKYIWPVGFRSKRTYASMKDPDKKVLYTSEILDGGEVPLFRVTPEDQPDKPIDANSATKAWTTVIKTINDKKTVATGKRMFTAVSGPEYFGYTNPPITKLIQELPKVAENAPTYEMRSFEPIQSKEKDKPTAETPKRKNPPRASSRNKRTKTLESEAEEDKDSSHATPVEDKTVDESQPQDPPAGDPPASLPEFKPPRKHTTSPTAIKAPKRLRTGPQTSEPAE